MSATLASFDWTLVQWLNASAVRFPVLDALFSHLMDLRPLIFASLLMVPWYFWFDEGTGGREKVRATIAITLLGGLIALVVGRLLAEGLPFRERPYSLAELGLRPIPLGPAELLRSWSSFPSDHATMVFALSTGIWMVSRALGVLAFLVSVFFVCLPRVAMGLHFPTDILGGAAVGIATTLALHAERIRTPASLFILRLERRWSGIFYALMFLMTFEIARMFDDIREPVSIFFHLLHRLH